MAGVLITGRSTFRLNTRPAKLLTDKPRLRRNHGDSSCSLELRTPRMAWPLRDEIWQNVVPAGSVPQVRCTRSDGLCSCPYLPFHQPLAQPMTPITSAPSSSSSRTPSSSSSVSTTSTYDSFDRSQSKSLVVRNAGTTAKLMQRPYKRDKKKDKKEEKEGHDAKQKKDGMSEEDACSSM